MHIKVGSTTLAILHLHSTYICMKSLSFKIKISNDKDFNDHFVLPLLLIFQKLIVAPSCSFTIYVALVVGVICDLCLIRRLFPSVISWLRCIYFVINSFPIVWGNTSVYIFLLVEKNNIRENSSHSQSLIWYQSVFDPEP